MSKKLVFWIGLVSAIITIILAVIPWFAKKPSLSAYIEGMNYYLAPSDFTSAKNDKYDTQKIRNNHIFKLSIENKGEIEAEDVTLMLGYDSEYIEAVVLKKNKEPEILKKPTKSLIGNIKPSEKVEVIIWSIHKISENNSILKGRDNVILSHRNGVVKIQTPIEGTGIIGYTINFILDYWLIAYIIFAVLVFYFPAAMFNKGVKSAQNNKNEAGVNDPEKAMKLISEAWSNGAISESEYQDMYKKILKKAIGENET